MTTQKGKSPIKLLVIVVLLMGSIWLYNGLVASAEGATSSWAQVESNYQRRADLIPNLVSTVKAFMEHEKSVLIDVTKQRSQSNDLGIAVKDLQDSNTNASAMMKMAKDKMGDASYMGALSAAQKGVSFGVTRLLATVENYPQLRSSDNVLSLQDQLEGTENRINVARMNFNKAVKYYNESIRKLPMNLVASSLGFERKAYFEADKGAQKAVDVNLK